MPEARAARHCPWYLLSRRYCVTTRRILYRHVAAVQASPSNDPCANVSKGAVHPWPTRSAKLNRGSASREPRPVSHCGQQKGPSAPKSENKGQREPPLRPSYPVELQFLAFNGLAHTEYKCSRRDGKLPCAHRRAGRKPSSQSGNLPIKGDPQNRGGWGANSRPDTSQNGRYPFPPSEPWLQSRAPKRQPRRQPRCASQYWPYYRVSAPDERGFSGNIENNLRERGPLEGQDGRMEGPRFPHRRACRRIDSMGRSGVGKVRHDVSRIRIRKSHSVHITLVPRTALIPWKAALSQDPTSRPRSRYISPSTADNIGRERLNDFGMTAQEVSTPDRNASARRPGYRELGASFRAMPSRALVRLGEYTPPVGPLSRVLAQRPPHPPARFLRLEDALEKRGRRYVGPTQPSLNASYPAPANMARGSAAESPDSPIHPQRPWRWRGACVLPSWAKLTRDPDDPGRARSRLLPPIRVTAAASRSQQARPCAT